MIKLNPPHRCQHFSESFISCHPPCLYYPPSTTFLLIYTTLLYLFSPFSGIGSPVHLEKLPLPPASTARLCALCLSALDLLHRFHLGPRTPAPRARFCRLFPCSSAPLLPPSTSPRPCWPLWFIPSCLHPYTSIDSNYSPPLLALTYGPVPDGPEEICDSSLWSSVLLSFVLPPHLILFWPISWCLPAIYNRSWRRLFMCNQSD